MTVKTVSGDEITYRPHRMAVMTAQSKVYREEQREFAEGDRVRLTEPNAQHGIRKGDFGTIMAIGDGLEVRLDKGQSVQLTNEQARHIEHGYAVDGLKTGGPERVLLSQDGSLPAASEAASLSRPGREVSVYVSDGSAQANAVSRSIAAPEQLMPSIASPEQQQSEAPANIIAPGQSPALHHHRHGR